MPTLTAADATYRVLVVDDDDSYAAVVAEWLRESGHHVDVQTSPEGGLARAQDEPYDVILLDLAMPRVDGLSFIQQLDGAQRPEVIVLSGGITVRSAVQAMKLGAFDCVPKTDTFDSVDVLVRRAGEAHRRDRELALLTRRVERQAAGPELIAQSPAMLEILAVLGDVAASNVSILLTGESGTGKDVLARQVHRLSGRAAGPFVDVNCAALSESLLEAELFGYEKGAFTGAAATTRGLAEAADGGTLFLDEVAEMPTPLQAKLLRMTEDRTLYRVGGRQRIRVDIRIVAASNRDLAREIAGGRLREDLYYRLAGVEIRVPPLRERPQDVAPLAEHYLRRAVRQAGRGPAIISPAAMAALAAYRWPGNIRELRNLMDRMALMIRSSSLEPSHLPADVLAGQSVAAPGTATPPPSPSLKEMERMQIQKVLDEEDWHHRRASIRLGLPPRTLYRKIRAYGLSRPRRDEPTTTG
jgi:DNA-binding NtrC family response regulator